MKQYSAVARTLADVTNNNEVSVCWRCRCGGLHMLGYALPHVFATACSDTKQCCACFFKLAARFTSSTFGD